MMWIAFTTAAALACAGGWWLERKRRLQAERRERARQQQIAALEAQAQDSARRANAQRELLFDSMVEGVLLLDRQDTVRLVNRGLLRLFHLDRDVRGRSLMEAFRLHQLQEFVSRVRQEGRLTDAEMVLPGLEPRWLQLSGSALALTDGSDQEVLLVFHDVTHLKQLEARRKEFVANVSHELRTPISLLKGYAETLLDGAKDDPAVAARFLQKILKHADRLTYLIEDLLNLSRLESGQVVLNVQPVQLRDLAERILDDLRSLAKDHGTVLANQIPVELKALADADRVQQVLHNLVENALKHAAAAHRVELTARKQDNGQLRISVTDDGPGIPREIQSRLFERFFRVDGARSREQGGTGLGLAIVKHIVQAHGGDVGVISEPGHGATFYFSLPNAGSVENSSPAQEPIEGPETPPSSSETPRRP
jgi:two-component system phosphate regulon sensor histidine kinase PhoR